MQASILITVLSLILASNAYSETPGTAGNEKPEPYIAAGGSSSIAYNDKGDIWFWGDEYDNESPIYPVRLDEMNDLSQISHISAMNVILSKRTVPFGSGKEAVLMAALFRSIRPKSTV